MMSTKYGSTNIRLNLVGLKVLEATKAKGSRGQGDGVEDVGPQYVPCVMDTAVGPNPTREGIPGRVEGSINLK